ncbi:MAG TPA: tRNA (adenosine(37)-N6)-dimethylallyltransferase MiaA [Myxococcota bacterium]|nr:tRNA (adenosine(37)-N6)-dimethylallyltransferase MiaA [Myxococcota bacterium]
MTHEDPRPPVVVVTGPTAAGKSACAIRLAERFDGEIVNADSMQVYRYLDIGTAKPSAKERGRVAHHVIDVALPDEIYSAGRYAVDARSSAARIHARGRAVFLAGGTGLYIRAFLSGLLGAGGADESLRQQLEEEHASAAASGDPLRLHRRLAEIDPAAAARIHPHDLRRVIRALELCLRAGSAASAIRTAHGFADHPYRALHLALDPGREELDLRIDRRCEAMIESGLLREVRGLRAMGYGPELRSMQAIGYRHMAPVVDGSDTLSNAVAAMKRDTRRFARRQRTWIRSVPEVVSLHPDDEDAVVKSVETFLRS